MHRCGAGGELSEGREGAEHRDNGEAERRRWTGWPARCSGGVSASGWRRTGQGALVGCSGQGALVGCSGAGGARDCGCEAAELADNGEQRRRWQFGGDAEWRRS
jgi:hypothetical protein